jgi:hypothetical protein
MRKENPKVGIVVGILCLALAVAGIAALTSDTSIQPADSVPPADPESPPVLSLHRNPVYSNSVVIGGSEGTPVELNLEHQKDHVNASGWNEYTIRITNPNAVDIHKTIYLEGTRYNWDATEGWVPDSDFKGKTVATLANMTVHPEDTVQVTVPMQLKATGERNFYIFKVRSEDA